MTAQCRWLNTVQSAQSGCPAGIWFPIKFPKTSPAWIALRSPICAVRCCPHFRQQTGRRIPSLSRFGRIREAGGTQIFVTTSPPAADGRRLFCHGHSSFQTPGRQGLSVQACIFVSKPITPHKLSVSFGSSVPCGGTMAVWLHLLPSIPLLLLS